MSFQPKPEILLSYLYLLRWSLLAVIAGIAGSGTVHGFVLLLDFSVEHIHSIAWAPPLIAVIGAALVGGVIYRLEPESAGEGLPSYIHSLRYHKGHLPFAVTFFKVWAALITLATYGSGGIVGPLGRVSSGIMYAVHRQLLRLKLLFQPEDAHTAVICGMAGVVGAVFHASVGGGIFAVEVIQRSKMGYKDIFPAILASSTAVFISKVFGWQGFYPIQAPNVLFDVSTIGWVLLISVLAGAVGGGYTSLYRLTAKLFKRQHGRVIIKLMIGSGMAASIGWLINPELLGTSRSLTAALFNNDTAMLSGRLTGIASIGIVCLIMLAAKAVGNALTVGSGMSAGFAGPTVISGMLLGAAVGHFIGLDPASPAFFSLVAAGFSGMFASVMNVPLAAAIMTIELFGLQYSLPAGMAAVIGFQITRHKTIYDFSLPGSGVHF